MTTFCPRCGTARVRDYAFCPSCGLALDPEEEQPELANRDRPLIPSSTPWPAIEAPVDLDSIPAFDGRVDCPRGPHPDLVKKVSALAALGQREFALPPAPVRPGSAWGVFSVLFVIFFAIGLLMVPGTVSQRPVPAEMSGAMLAAGIALVLFFFAAPLVLMFWWKHRVSLRRERDWASDHAEWTEGRKRWEKAYFCTKDDLLFIPTRDGWISLETAT